MFGFIKRLEEAEEELKTLRKDVFGGSSGSFFNLWGDSVQGISLDDKIDALADHLGVRFDKDCELKVVKKPVSVSVSGWVTGVKKKKRRKSKKG